MIEFPIPLIDWPTVLPVLLVIATGVIALIAEMIFPKRNNNIVVGISIIGLVVAGYYTLPLFEMGAGDTFAGMVLRDHIGSLLQLLLIGVCALSFLFSERYLRDKGIAFAEFYPLATWATAGGMIMVSTTNMIMMFLGLEVLSIALYCLAGMSRREQKSEESALKYFLLGAFASAFFLYGIAFVYGATGSIDISAISAVGTLPAKEFETLTILGVVLLIVGLGFKTALAPFHQWTPDVYQGAPTNVTAFMAAASKIAAFGAFYRVLIAAVDIQQYWFPALFGMAILTMITGNVCALAQKDIKRILGYSSIAHAGYILVALLAHIKAPEKVTMDAVVYYLMAYSLMTIGAFAIITMAAKNGKERTRVTDLNGLWQKSKFAAIAMMIFMFSLMGMPPTAGFAGKFMIFMGALEADLVPLAIVLGLSSVASVFYYWAIIRACLIEEEGAVRTDTAKMSPGLFVACVVCVAGVFGAVLFAKPILEFIEDPAAEEFPIEASMDNSEIIAFE